MRILKGRPGWNPVIQKCLSHTTVVGQKGSLIFVSYS